MALINPSLVRNVPWLTEQQERDALNFLQGAVYCWCKNRPGEWFSMRDLMGGENFHWEETPLQPLYEHFAPAPDAVEEAGKASGWLLKKVIANDARRFDDKKKERIRKYLWIPSAGTVSAAA
jgi:hypothetical protein